MRVLNSTVVLVLSFWNWKQKNEEEMEQLLDIAAGDDADYGGLFLSWKMKMIVVVLLLLLREVQCFWNSGNKVTGNYPQWKKFGCWITELDCYCCGGRVWVVVALGSMND